MELTKRITLFAVLLFITLGVFAQDVSPGQLGDEILRLERRLLQAGLSPAERHNALTRLASLRQLSGDIYGAAANWLEAMAANPSDDNARLSGAFCLAAIGEWETSALALQPMIASGRRSSQVLQARYLDACLKTWLTADASALVALASNAEFAALHPVICYTLWRSLVRNPATAGAGGAELWKTRLLAEFPQSLEARTAAAEAGGETSSAVRPVQSPIWLLFPGPSDTTALPAVPAAPPSTSEGQPHIVEAGHPAAAVPAVPLTPPVVAGPVLQTGAFGKEANALAQVEQLLRAGFPATVIRKTVNGADIWAVTVLAGQDASRTMQELRRAGFDSFQVR